MVNCVERFKVSGLSEQSGETVAGENRQREHLIANRDKRYARRRGRVMIRALFPTAASYET